MDLTKLKVEQLKDILDSYGLSKTGLKNILIKRIKDYEASGYESLTAVQLKKVLKDRKLSLSGSKHILVKRIRDDDLKSRTTSPVSKLTPSPKRPPVSKKTTSPVSKKTTSSVSKKTPYIPGPVFLTGVEDADIRIILELDYDDLLNACKTNKGAARICDKDSFWNTRIQRIYNVDLTEYKGKDSFRTVYDILSYYEGDIKDETLEAVRRGYFPLVKQTVESGDLNDTDIGWTLVEAAKIGNMDMVKYLVEDVGAIFGEETLVTPAKEGQVNVVKYLLEQHDNFHDDTKSSALYIAAQEGHVGIVKILMEMGAQPAVFVDLIEIAAQAGHIPLLRYLMEELQLEYNIDHVIRSALHSGKLASVRYLVRKFGRDISNEAYEGALFSANSRGYKNIAHYLKQYLEKHPRSIQ